MKREGGGRQWQAAAHRASRPQGAAARVTRPQGAAARVTRLVGLAASFVVALSLSTPGLGQTATPRLLHDIQSVPFNGPLRSAVRTTVAFEGAFFYPADDGIHGRELWRSDGTPAGTHMVRDICPGVCSGLPERLTVAGGQIFFTAQDGETGVELWRSDGTKSGTARVADIVPGPDSSWPLSFTALGHLVLFAAATADPGYELWRSDGSASGTFRLAGMPPSWEGGDPSQTVVVGEVAVFTARTAAYGSSTTLFRTDGTVEGTRELVDFAPSRVSGAFDNRRESEWPVVGNTAYFSVDSRPGGRVWRTDGTVSGTFPVGPAFSSRVPRELQASQDLVGFLAPSTPTGNDRSVWVSDGSVAGSLEISSTLCDFPLRLNGTEVGLFFKCYNTASGGEVWFTDGTIAGTRQLADLAPGPAHFGLQGRMQPLPGGVIFSGDRSGGQPASVETWFSNGTPQGTVLLPITGAEQTRQSSQVLGGRVLLWGSGFAQPVLHVTDGSPSGTMVVGPEHAQSSSFPRQLSAFADSRWFFQTLGLGGRTPFFPDVLEWVATDGSGLSPASLAPYPEWLVQPPFAESAGRVFFNSRPRFADPAGGPPGALFSVSDQLTDLRIATGPAGNRLQEFHGQVYMGASRSTPTGRGLVVVDPVTEQVGLIPGPSPAREYPFLGLDAWLETEQRLFFPSVTGFWSIDGQGSPLDHLPGVTASHGLAHSSSGYVFFTAETPSTGREVWSVDPSSGASTLLEMRPGVEPGVFRADRLTGDNTPFVGVALGDLYLFTGDDGITGPELWATPPEGPPVLLADIAPGAQGSYPQALTVVGDRALFRANDGAHGSELWVTDGTADGTLMLCDIRAGPDSSLPLDLQLVDGVLLFSALDEGSGRELWVSDGTVTGTHLLHDIAPGAHSSSPSGFLVRSDVVLFSANDAQHGFELWALDRPVTVDPLLFRDGFESGGLGVWSRSSLGR